MKYILIIFCFLFMMNSPGMSQQQPLKGIRIVDTLSPGDKANRNPVLLRAEVDSIIAAHLASVPQQQNAAVNQKQEVELSFSTPVITAALATLFLISAFFVLMMRRQKQIIRASIALKQQVKEVSQVITTPDSTIMTEKQSRQKAALEKKIDELSAELEKQKLSNKSALEEYQSIKEKIASIYKVRNYPGYGQKKPEGEIVRELFSTEKSVAAYAFEKFLKPLISLVDANKNNPARISKEDTDKVLDLLVSLSLFYIEYLYLRIDELSVGGHIVERIGSHARGNGIDPALLKELNKDHGSRALALRLALDKKGVGSLSYPVFDETNLNHA